MYKIIILCGKAGSGKDTIVKELCEDYPNKFTRVVSYTTRPPREGEKEGIDYHFINSAQMAQKIIENEMIEVAEFNKWFYGTSVDCFQENKINLMVLNPIGIENMLDYPGLNARINVIYIDCNNKIRLMRQLTREENPDVKEIIRRYGTDELDFVELPFTYTTLINEKPEDLTLVKGRIKEFAEVL